MRKRDLSAITIKKSELRALATLSEQDGTTIVLDDRARIAIHEEVITRGLSTFIEVGAALLAIRDGKLYRHDGCGSHREHV